MNKNKKIVKRTAAGLAVLMAGTACLGNVETVYAAGQEKEETVYVKADANGAVEQTIVSNWLKNGDKKQQISDVSELTGIKNVKGDETFTQKGEELIWQAEGNDIYYQGETKKELPAGVKVTYYLDGKEIRPEELAGKSGKVRMRFAYTNNSREGAVYTPFALVTGVILPSDHFTNVEAVNGKVISDGSKSIVVGMGFPGLAESLKLSENEATKEMEVPDYFEITADAEDFALAMTATAASPLDLDEFGLSDADSLEELQDSMEELQDASTKLVDGSGELADGVKTLQDACKTLVEGMDTLDEKTGELADGIKTLNGKKGDLVKGLNTLSDGIGKLNKKKSELTAGIKDLSKGLNTLNKQKGELVEGVGALAEGSGTLAEGVGMYVPGACSLAQGVQKLNGSLQAMTGTARVQRQTLDANAEAGQKTAADARAAQGTAGDIAAAITLADSTISSLSVSIEQNQAVLDSLRDVQGRLGEIPGALLAGRSDTYNHYVNVLSTDISSLENDISVQKQSLQAWQDFKKSVDVEGLKQSLEGIEESASGIKAPAVDPAAALQGVAQQVNVMAAASEGLADEATVKRLTDGAAALDTGIGKVKTGTEKLAGGVEALAAGGNDLRTASGLFSSAIGKLAKGGGKLVTGAGTLSDGIGKLAEGSSQLKGGTGELADGGARLTDGVDKLSEGADTLRDGMKEFDEEGIRELTKTFNEDLQEIFDRIDQVADAGKAYRSFSGAKAPAESSVKFIIETGSISKE